MSIEARIQTLERLRRPSREPICTVWRYVAAENGGPAEPQPEVVGARSMDCDKWYLSRDAGE